MTCSRCGGTKVVQGYACPGFKPYERPCPMCGGAGALDADHVRWLEAGEALRAARVLRDLSLRECARWMGVTPVSLSGAEHGDMTAMGTKRRFDQLADKERGRQVEP